MESIHPLIVHFPIALLLTSFLLDSAGWLFKRPGLHIVGLWNLWLGTLGAAAAALSGLQAEDVVAKHSFEIGQVIEWHKRLGVATLILGCVIVGWRLWRWDQLSRLERPVSLLLALVMCVSLIAGAYLGGRLVYEFGVGGSFGTSDSYIDTPTPHRH